MSKLIYRSFSVSPTLALDTKVKELQAQGLEVINLSLGEPDFATPDKIKLAAIKAIKNGYTHYTPTAGIKQLREAIARKLAKENHLNYRPSEIVVCVGSKQALFHAFFVLSRPGDEVLLATPTWNTYVEQIKIVGAKPVFIPLKPPFKLKAAQVAKKISSKTKVLLLNSPANPTGAVIDRSELKKIAQLAVRNNLSVISDEIYEKLVYSGQFFSIASLNEKIKQRTVTINGFSKSFAMTGWRVGFAAGPTKIIEAMIALQSQTTSNTSSISQWAALSALDNNDQSVEKMKTEFKKRKDFVIAELSKIKEISFSPPEGAFYVFVHLEKDLKKDYPSSEKWCQELLAKKKVAVVPGEAFFCPGFFRLSFASSLKVLNEGLSRLKDFLSENLKH